MNRSISGLVAAALWIAAVPPALAQKAPAASAEASGDETAGESASDLAKKIQNPIGDLYSFPFQSNTNFGFGPHGGTQDVLNIQPVIRIHITPDWNIITRTILPLVWTPDLAPAPSVPFGTAPVSASLFLSPKNPVDHWLWGALVHGGTGGKVS